MSTFSRWLALFAIVTALAWDSTALVHADPPVMFPPIRDRALVSAHYIARFQQRRREQRVGITHSMWRTLPNQTFEIRREAECLGELSRARIRWEPLAAHSTLPPAPVIIKSPINEVRFHKKRPDAPLVLACELATRLHVLADVVKAHGVNEVEVMSAYRRTPTTSFHHVGLAIDITRMWSERGDIHVIDHFEVTPERGTCEGDPPNTWQAQTLRAIACDLAATDVFSTVLTPNYGRGHENHLHIDIRPNDPVRFLR